MLVPCVILGQIMTRIRNTRPQDAWLVPTKSNLHSMCTGIHGCLRCWDVLVEGVRPTVAPVPTEITDWTERSTKMRRGGGRVGMTADG